MDDPVVTDIRDAYDPIPGQRTYWFLLAAFALGPLYVLSALLLLLV